MTNTEYLAAGVLICLGASLAFLLGNFLVGIPAALSGMILLGLGCRED